MKKIILIAIAVMVSFGALAQKKPKIKGNKLVSDVFNSLEDFDAIEISDNLAVNITQSGTNGYHIKTDSNLLDVVKFDIVNGVLKIHTTHKITGFKTLEIALNFNEVDAITLRNDAELTSKNRLNFEKINFMAYDNADYELDMKAGTGNFKLYKSTTGKLHRKSGDVIFYLDGNADLKGEIVADHAEINIKDRADIDVDGDVTNLKIQTAGTTDVKVKKLKATFAELQASNASDIYLYASKELRLYAKGKSHIYVYGNPDIKVDGLNDKSQIIKK